MAMNLKKTPILQRLIRAIVPIVIILAGGAAWAYFQTTAPRMEKQTPLKAASMVAVTTVQNSDTPVVISAMGTVVASRQVTLTARVSGDVLWVSPHFIPGGYIAKGEEILRLDPADYEVALKKMQSALAEAKADLSIEQGNQTIAREELRLLSETAGDAITATDLALRKPQLQKAQAAVASAEADLRAAMLDLERTVVKAPFNTLVTECLVNVGANVSAQTSLVTIADTDEYWVEAVVPVDRLAHLDLTAGSPAVVRSQSGKAQRQGRAVRTTGKISETSRMAKVIVAIADPLGIKANGAGDQLILGDYVTVKIQGRTLKSVIELPRTALRDGNSVWLYDNGKLAVKPVTVSWKDNQRVYITQGLASGNQVIVSDLSIPVQGMQLKLDGTDEIQKTPGPVAPKEG